MRASRLILLLVAVLAIAGATVATELVSTRSAPDLGAPVVIKPAPKPPPSSPTPEVTLEPAPSPGPSQAVPVPPRVPPAGDDDNDGRYEPDDDDLDDDDLDDD